MKFRLQIDVNVEREYADVILRSGVSTNPPLSDGVTTYIARLVWDRPLGGPNRFGRFGRGRAASGVQVARGRIAALAYRVAR